MSNNSIIFLVRVGKGYRIVHADADTGDKYKTLTAKTAEEALVVAQDMQDSTGAEYNVMIDVMKTKEL